MAAVLAPERTPLWLQAAGTLLGAVAFATDRLSARFAEEPGEATPHHLAVAVGLVAAALMVAVSVHLMLSLPDGRLRTRARRVPGRPELTCHVFILVAIVHLRNVQVG